MATLRLVLGFGVMALLVMVGIKLIPPFFSNYEFEDAIKSEALRSTYSTRNEDDIRDAVVKHAREYDIELTAKQVHVTRTGGFGTGALAIEADYSVPLELPGYSTTLDFHPSSLNKGVF
ncbi:MAG: hypothetical protein WAL71_12085 [Terriglobales bacterium]|jgi:hypothetical protein